MILEELLNALVSLISHLVIHKPPLSRENVKRDHSFIFKEDSERDEAHDGLIHREYEQSQVTDLPYYEENIALWGQDDTQSTRTMCDSIFRSCKANFGLVFAAIFLLGILVCGVAYLDLNTNDACFKLIQNNLNVNVPLPVKVVQMVGMCVFILPVMSWFPACIAMLWGLKEFKRNYLHRLCPIVLATTAATFIYRIVIYDKMPLTKGNILWS